MRQGRTNNRLSSFCVGMNSSDFENRTAKPSFCPAKILVVYKGAFRFYNFGRAKPSTEKSIG
jgi:hypothetical protein